MRFSSRFILAVFFLAAACQPLPRPYQPDGKDQLDIEALAQQSMIVLTTFEGPAPRDQNDLLIALEAVLLSEGLNVIRQKNGPMNNLLLATSSLSEPRNGQEEVTLIWEVMSARGERLADHRQDFVLPEGLWRAGVPELYASLSKDAGSALAGQLVGPRIEEAAIAGFPRARLVVGSITGAPGDGEQALSRALARAIELEGLPLAGLARERDILIDCEITVTDLGGGQELIELVWIASLLEETDGGASLSEIGRISQANALPTGTLDGNWGPTARIIAEGTLDGLLDLLSKVERL